MLRPFEIYDYQFGIGYVVHFMLALINIRSMLCPLTGIFDE